MRLTLVASMLVLAGISSFAAARPAGEEAFTLDLSVIPGGSTYFLKCSKSTTLANCGLVTVWQQTNGHPGLQTGVFAYGKPPRPVNPDYSILP